MCYYLKGQKIKVQCGELFKMDFKRVKFVSAPIF